MKFRFKSINQKGQILVEYLLLMVIALGCVTLLSKALIGRSDTSAGIVIKAWHSILRNVANDLPDCANQTDMSSANCPE